MKRDMLGLALLLVIGILMYFIRQKLVSSPTCNLRDYQLDIIGDTAYMYADQDTIGRFLYKDSSSIGQIILEDNQ